MPQSLLPIFLDGTIRVSDLISYQRREGFIYYFHGAMPVFSHAEEDNSSFRMITSQFIANGVCRVVEVARAFGVSEISVKRNLSKFRRSGSAAFFAKRKRRGSNVLTGEIVTTAQSLLDQGKSRSEVASELGLNKSTLSKGIARGVLREPLKKKLMKNPFC